MNTQRLYPIAVLMAVISAGCATLRPPETLSPVGDAAFYARRVILAVEQIQTLAIEGEQAGAISVDDARTIITATGKAHEAGVSLAATLKAGAVEATARQRWAAAISTALDEILPKLSPNTRALVEPYVKTVKTLLTVFAVL